MLPSLVITTLLTLMTVALDNCCAHAQRVDPSIDWTKVNVVTVIMTEYAFSPPRVRIQHGIPTRLHLVNNGTEIHDFTAPDFFKAVDLQDSDVIASSGVSTSRQPALNGHRALALLISCGGGTIYNETAEPFVWTKSKVHQRRVKGRRLSDL